MTKTQPMIGSRMTKEDLNLPVSKLSANYQLFQGPSLWGYGCFSVCSIVALCSSYLIQQVLKHIYLSTISERGGTGDDSPLGCVLVCSLTYNKDGLPSSERPNFLHLRVVTVF